MWSRVSNTGTSGLSESVKPTFLGSEVCNELYYWATRSRKTCLKRISNSHCKSRGLNVLLGRMTIPLECQVGRALGVMHAHLGEKALTSDQATQPNNQPAEHSINLISHPVWQSSLPIYVCPVSSMKVKDISEQPRNQSVMVAVGCHWFGPQAIDDT